MTERWSAFLLIVIDMPVSNETISRVLMAYRGYLTAYIWSLVPDEHMVEDVLQEAAAVTMSRAADIDGEAALVAWMRTTCRYLALAAARASAKQPGFLSEEALSKVESAWGHIAAEPDSQRLDGLRFCLSQLSPKAQTLVRLKYIEGLDSKEIARRQSIKIDSVYMGMSRIIGRLRACMNRYASRKAEV